MILVTSFLDAGTWVPLGSLVIVAAVCWRMASAKAEYAADLRHLQEHVADTNVKVADTNQKLDTLTLAVSKETGSLWEANSEMRDRMGRVEGRLNGSV